MIGRLSSLLCIMVGCSFQLAFADSTAPPQPLSITNLTPTGDDVPAGRQLVISFNRPVVPLGNMERKAEELPITITPALPCEWRWINTSALACNLPEKASLAYSTHYTVEIKPGIKAQDGATIAEPFKSQFITARPAITYKQFHEWKAPGHPVVRLVFNQPVSKQSVSRHVFMLAAGAESHYFRPPTDAHIDLSVSPDLDEHELPFFLPLPGEKYKGFITHESQKSDDDLHNNHGQEARRVWLVEPNREIPLDTHVSLKTEAGLVSAMGAEPGIKEETIVEFDTFPAFAFLGIKCTSDDNRPLMFLAQAEAPVTAKEESSGTTRKHSHHYQPDKDEVIVPPGNPAHASCDPLESTRLIFNAPVERGDAGKALHFAPPVKGWAKDASGDESDSGEGETEANEDASSNPTVPYQLRTTHDKDQLYEIWLPAGLKAATEYTIESRRKNMGYIARAWHWAISLLHDKSPVEVRDMFGQSLAEPIDLHFATDHRIPHFVFDHHDAVLEKSVDSDVPLFVDNLEKTILHYRSVLSATAQTDQTFIQNAAAVKDIQFAMPFGIREALGGKTGALFGSLDTQPETRASPYDRRIFAEVTPYQVHVKLGHFNSLVWVTDLATGQPVAQANVTVYKDSLADMGTPKEIAGNAVTDTSGIALLAGTETLDPQLAISDYGNDDQSRFFVRVEKGDDIALLPLSYSFLINSYRSSGNDSVSQQNKERYGHIKTWGLTAQGIYRAGDTIQYKIYVRNQDNNRFVPAPRKGYTLKIIDAMGKKVFAKKGITLSEFGSFNGEFTVPKEGSVGWYKFKLSANFDGSQPDADADDAADEEPEQPADNDSEQEDQNNDTGKFQWTPLRVLVSDFTPSPFKVTGQINGDLFHADQEVESTSHAELHSGGPYTKASTRVTALLESKPFISKHPLAKNFQFDSFDHEEESQQIFQKIELLDDKGELKQHFPLGKPHVIYGTLMVESAVQDERGKYVTGSASAQYAGVDRLVGLRSTQWLYTTGKPANIEYIVVDEHGVPTAGTDVSVQVEHEVTKSARVKSAGNAYITEYNNSWEKVSDCKGQSEASASSCSFTPKEAGNYRATATIKDTKGNEHKTKLFAYALGDDFVVWGDESDTSLAIIPEKTDYKIGDKARYLIKNPYPGAKALVTIERYGVLDQFVQTLNASTPVIEFPIKPDYLPGFYLSVTVMSPRVDKPIEGQVDLGKPAFRMGYISVPVKDPYKEMVVTVRADKDVYKPRDKVTVTLHAAPRKADTKEPMELAVAVLDESVFDLVASGKDAFDPYRGFYKLESLDLRNYSLLLKLVGRQKFEKKGANPGGDGGRDTTMRSLFKFVSYWNPSILPDKDGNATITFDAPDNLTGWRVLAIATTPSDRFGLGEGNFKVNRPTEVRPVMPNQVTEGDSFNAGFSVMNRTDKPRDITVTIQAEGNVQPVGPFKQIVKLPPYQHTNVFMPVKTTPVPVSRDVTEGAIRFQVTAQDAIDGDGLTHSVPVHKQRSLEVAANYATTTEAHSEEPIEFPPHIVPDVGNVSVVASPTVIGNIAGAFKYLKDYPYLCWEQQLTKGVMAAHFKDLKAYLPQSLVWTESESLPQRTLDNAGSFQAPNGGMAFFVAQDQYVDPYLSAYTSIAFNWLRADGYHVSEAVETKLDKYLQALLRNDAMPDFYSEGMASSVRAVALAALAEHGAVKAEDVERYAPHVDKMSLFGKAHFLQAALKTGASQKAVDDVVQKILNTSNQTGGKFIFSETLDNGYLRILASPLRDNCAILESFTRYAATDKGKATLADVPFKLVRMITQSRKNRDHWENTQENMFCMNALVDYARVYENTTPDMKITASLDGQSFGTATFKSIKDDAVTLERPIQAGDAGRKATLTIDKAGPGRLYYSARVSYALPPEESHAENAGLELHREYSVERGGKWELLKAPATIKRGELVRVDLYVSAPAARNFVVVDDPVPGGLEPVNSQLATASKVDAAKGAFAAAGGAWWFHYSDWMDYGTSRWNFYHQELRDHAARFYADYLPAGNYHLSYTAQAIASGSFTVMPAMAQEMYDPDVYGKAETLQLEVREK